MKPKILCLSRSFMTKFFTVVEDHLDEYEFLHIVQSHAEKKQIEAQGKTVVLTLEEAVNRRLSEDAAPKWSEPEDMRATLRYPWDALSADRHIPNHDRADRDKIAGIIQSEFEALFATHAPAGFLSEPVAIFPTHYALYLCRKHNVKPLLWANTYVPGFFYFADGMTLSKPVRRPVQIDTELSNEIKSSVRSYLDRVAADTAGPIYHHKFASRKQSPLHYLDQRQGDDALIISPGLGMIVIQIARTVRARLAQALFPLNFDYITAATYREHRFYLRNLMTRVHYYDSPPEVYSPDNIFFPLQYEPEASLIYHAPSFQDQHVVIENIARALPEGKLLWIKEHPNQFGALGAPHWKRLRKQYGNLRFVYGRKNGRELIKACALSVCITSTAGLDAMIIGRRSIIMGDCFFRNMTGAVPVSSYDELIRELNEPVNYGKLDNRDQLAKEISAFGRDTYRGDPQPSTSLYSAENLGRLVAALRQELSG